MMRMRKGNGFWRFCFSLLPGAGEMYMGFMKQGAMLMTLFFGCWALSGWLNLNIFGFVLPVIWFYGFFHVHNLAGLPNEEFYSVEDTFNIGEWKFFDVIGQERCRKYFAWALILIGCAGIWQIVTCSVTKVLNHYGLSVQIWKDVTNNVPQVIFSIIIIYIGVQMVKGKKQQLEDKGSEEHDA